MRLCTHHHGNHPTPEAWATATRAAGYSATNCPIQADADDATIAAYLAAARKENVLIAEVTAWSNPLDPDSEKAAKAVELCIRQLDLAERVGSLCCVNIAGSRNPEKWDGPHPDNFSSDTFDLIVETTRKIVDAVKPKRTFYTLETMPWIFPSSPDEYLNLIRAIDRPSFAVHLDPVNMINTPKRIYYTADFLRECFAKLGPWIKSCHAKDITIGNTLTLHLDECRPGTGMLDYSVYLHELSKLHPDTTLRLEHLKEDEYPLAVQYIQNLADQEKLSFI